jgi:hypothetical protein
VNVILRHKLSAISAVASTDAPPEKALPAPKIAVQLIGAVICGSCLKMVSKASK